MKLRRRRGDPRLWSVIREHFFTAGRVTIETEALQELLKKGQSDLRLLQQQLRPITTFAALERALQEADMKLDINRFSQTMMVLESFGLVRFLNDQELELTELGVAIESVDMLWQKVVGKPFPKDEFLF